MTMVRLTYLWIDATYVKVRQNGRIVPVAVIVARLKARSLHERVR